MKQVLNVYKPLGLTPFQTIQQIRGKHREYETEKIGFAGRLDPLAHGVLLLMLGETTKQREQYLNLPKVYEFETLFGLETDSYDVLGFLENSFAIVEPVHHVIARPRSGEAIPSKRLPRSFSVARNDEELSTLLKQFNNSHLGKQTQVYPPFSSKEVLGKPLYWWAKQNKISEITIPTREIEIYEFELLKTNQIQIKQLEELVTNNIKLVNGNFRQEETLAKWQDFFEQTKYTAFPTARFRIHCSSGTYVRGLVHEMGKYLGTGAITLEILRTQVGDYLLKDAKRV